jgi:undecaprenyl-diphosphatase
MDWSLVHALNTFLAAHDRVEDPITAYERFAELLFAGGLVLLFLLARGTARSSLRRLSAAAVASAGVALLAAHVLTLLVDRPRPFVVHPGAVHLFAAHAPDPGFPSDHASAAFAIAVAIALRDRRWGVVMLALAAVIAVGRVGMAVHYPSDVVAGALLGTASALALWAPPLRRVVHAVADAVGRALDGAMRATASALGRA